MPGLINFGLGGHPNNINRAENGADAVITARKVQFMRGVLSERHQGCSYPQVQTNLPQV